MTDNTNVSAFFFSPTIKNYKAVLCNLPWYEPTSVDYCDPTFARTLGNSIFIGLILPAITLVVGCMAAYALSRFRFMGRGTVSMAALMDAHGPTGGL